MDSPRRQAALPRPQHIHSDTAASEEARRLHCIADI
jgi:hypothetical protein